jgi:hypothetical protein
MSAQPSQDTGGRRPADVPRDTKRGAIRRFRRRASGRCRGLVAVELRSLPA